MKISFCSFPDVWKQDQPKIVLFDFAAFRELLHGGVQRTHRGW